MSLSYLHPSTAKLNRPAAVKDWKKACTIAHGFGVSEIIEDIPENYGVKRIDTETCKILIQAGVSKEDAEHERLGFECCYQWEKAVKQLKAHKFDKRASGQQRK
jgi:hypothetical protein